MDGRFKKGHKTWNKDMKGIHLSPSTEIKPGQWVGKGHPCYVDGVQRMTIDCVHLYTGNGTRVRRPRKVYEDNFGEIPKGFVIVHLDGDKDNDEPTNLEAISRAESMRRSNLKKK